MVIIKTYSANRRLYSTKDNKYITYVDLRKYVIDGLDVKIISCPDDEDITALVLTKALVDIGKELPIDTLRELILVADEAIKQRGVTKFKWC